MRSYLVWSPVVAKHITQTVVVSDAFFRSAPWHKGIEYVVELHDGFVLEGFDIRTASTRRLVYYPLDNNTSHT